MLDIRSRSGHVLLYPAKSVELYLGRDAREFHQGLLTKNQPVTVLVLLIKVYNKYLG